MFVGTLVVSSLSNAALVSHLNGQAVYDTDLNITWMADSTLAVSNTFGVNGIGITTGSMDWNTAQSWIGSMNAANYLGFSDWRLPTTLVPDPTCGGFFANVNCTGSELGHLFEIEQASTSGLFITAAEYYWSDTECGLNCAYAYFWHGLGAGEQVTFTKDLNPHPASSVLAGLCDPAMSPLSRYPPPSGCSAPACWDWSGWQGRKRLNGTRRNCHKVVR
ncbi:MAG: hypothetical protein WBQ78_06380 [Gammaproteobacteria bacterium]